MQAVITMCGSAADETCPMWLGLPVRAHWGVEDSAAALEADWEDAFDLAYLRLSRRAAAFLDLPIEDLSQADLQTALNNIGPQF